VPYYLFLPKSPKIFYEIYRIQSYFHSKLKHPEGIITQILVVAAFLYVGFVV
jgi:hypothetical protein